MCSVGPVQKDDTQHQKFLYHLRIQSSILNEMFFEWLLGSECVPLSIVKQMYKFFASNSQAMIRKMHFSKGTHISWVNL